MKTKLNNIIVLVIVIIITTAIVGCGGGSAGTDTADSDGATTSLDMTVTAVKKQQIVNSSQSMSAMAVNTGWYSDVRRNVGRRY